MGNKCFSKTGFGIGSFGTMSILFLWAYTSAHQILSVPMFYIFTAILSTLNGLIGGLLNLYATENNNYFLGICHNAKKGNIALLLVFLSIVIPPIYFDVLFPNLLNNALIIFWILGYIFIILFSIKIGTSFREAESSNRENIVERLSLYFKRVYARISSQNK